MYFVYIHHIIPFDHRAPKSRLSILCSLVGMKYGVPLGKPLTSIYLPVWRKTSMGAKESLTSDIMVIPAVAAQLWSPGELSKTTTTQSHCQPWWSWFGRALCVGIFTSSPGGSNEQPWLRGEALQAGTLLWPGSKGLWKTQRMKVSWGESKHPLMPEAVWFACWQKQVPGSLHSALRSSTLLAGIPFLERKHFRMGIIFCR